MCARRAGSRGCPCNPGGELTFSVQCVWGKYLTPDPYTTLEIRPHQPTIPAPGRP